MPQNLVKRFQNLSAARRDLVACLLLALAVLAVYCNVYHYDFLLDDQSLIITNVFLRDWHHLQDIFTHLNYFGSGAEKGFYRPVVQILQLITYQMFGLSTPPFHALNIILHVLNAALVYLLGRRLGFNAGAVFAAALLWSLHPIFTQQVTYISSIGELMWTMFSLLALIVLLPTFTTRKILLAIPIFILALGSKETAVVFPALAVVCLFIVSKSKDRLKPSTYLKTAPFWLLSVLYTVTYFGVNNYRPFNAGASPVLDSYMHHILPRILTSLATLPAYFSFIFYPVGLHMERIFPVFFDVFSWPVIAGTAMAAGALAQIILGKGKRGLPLSFGFIWFAATLAPVTGILIPTDAFISEGWLYMPTIGLALGVAQMLSVWIGHLKFKQAKPAVAVIVAVVALSLGIKTYFQNEVYQNPATFYDNIFKTGGYRSRAYPDLGDYYLNRREFDKSIENFKLAITNPDEHNVPSASMHAQLALAYLGVVSDEHYMITPNAVMEALPHSTHIPEAIDELDASLRLDPDFYFAHTILSVIYKFQGDERSANYHHQKMLETLHKLGRI